MRNVFLGLFFFRFWGMVDFVLNIRSELGTEIIANLIQKR